MAFQDDNPFRKTQSDSENPFRSAAPVQPPATASKAEVPTQRLRTAIGQGAMFGFGDEAEALARSLMGKETYSEAVKDIRSKIKAYQKDRPVEALAAEVGGGLLTGLGGAARSVAATGERLAAKEIAKRLATSAVGQGALTGAGTAEGDLSSRAAGAAVGGTVGGLLGAGLGALGKGATTALARGGLSPKPEVAAITSAMKAADKTLPQVRKEAAEFAALTPEARVMDVLGKPALRQASGIRIAGGRPGQQVEEAMAQRLATRPERMAEAMYQAAGHTPENAVQTVDDLIASRANKSRPLYDKFSQSAPQPSAKMDELLQTPFGQEVVARARRDALNNRVPFLEPAKPEVARAHQTIVDAFGVPAKIVEEKAVPTKYHPDFVNQIKKSMDDIIYEGRFARPELSGASATERRTAKAIRGEFVDAADEAFPTFAKARQVWAGENALKDAFETGQEWARKKVDPRVMEKELADMSASEREMVERGHLDGVRQLLDDGKLPPTTIRTPAFQARLAEIYGKKAPQVQKAFEADAQLTTAARGLTQGSQTAERQADVAGLDPRLLAEMGFDVATGRNWRAGLKASQALGARLQAPLREKGRAAAAEALLTPAGNIGSLLDKLMQEQRAREAGKLAQRVIAPNVGRLLGAQATRSTFE